MVKRFLGLMVFSLLMHLSYGQDTLPNFTLIERGDKVIVSWINPYESVIQLNVQRSYDSLTNFKTIFSPLSPELPQNGYTETKMPTNRVFYRIFFVLKGGAYFFTKSKRAGLQDFATPYTGKSSGLPTVLNGNSSGKITIKIKDAIYSSIPSASFPRFRDSVLQRTRDTVTSLNDSLVVISPYKGPENFRPSIYIYSVKEGISITLPSDNKRYSVKFFEEDGTPLFEISNVREQQLTLDKTNFLHAGWFSFELYEDHILKEKNKFFLSKDF